MYLPTALRSRDGRRNVATRVERLDPGPSKVQRRDVPSQTQPAEPAWTTRGRCAHPGNLGR
jgi:hypothetical protein